MKHIWIIIDFICRDVCISQLHNVVQENGHYSEIHMNITNVPIKIKYSKEQL